MSSSAKIMAGPASDKTALKALRTAVRNAIVEHARKDESVAVWSRGKVVELPAKNLVRHRPKNGTSARKLK